MPEVYRVLIHEKEDSAFVRQKPIWDKWKKNPRTHQISSLHPLNDVSYVDSIPRFNSLLMIGGQTADICVETHLRFLADYVYKNASNLLVVLSLPATWSMSFYDGFDEEECGGVAVIQRINREFKVNFDTTQNI